MKKFDELKYWLDLNEHIKTALASAGLGIAIVGLNSLTQNPTLKVLTIIALVFSISIIIMQLILGFRQIKRDCKLRKEYKVKYQRQLDNLKRTG
ncbi:hypothetical protein KAI04_00555 [Candidatus Pacearchaeota archaeon]|nr:hypothetical protein [Candidatus Pacearchaeota archaeon]